MENVTIKVEPTEKGEVVIRTGAAPKIERRKAIVIDSVDIAAPLKFWEKRKSHYRESTSGISFSYRKGIITLKAPYNIDEVDTDEVIGKMVLNPELVGLKINEGNYVTFQELHEQLRWMKLMFVENNQYTAIISKLTNFKAKIDTEIEKVKDEKGNSSDYVVTKVKNEIPLEFQLKTNIYEGQKEDIFNVNIIVKASGTQLLFTLESMDLYEMEESKKKSAMDEVLKGFESIICIEVA